MVSIMVTFHTYGILIIFQMGEITVYMVHTVGPQRLVRCNPTLLGNGQSHAFLPVVSQARQRRPFAILVPIYFLSLISSFMSHHLMLELSCRVFTHTHV